MVPRCFSDVLFCSFAMGGGAIGEKEKGRGERRWQVETRSRQTECVYIERR